jgi:CubicO group peptidase (beta-lactamase class C family)
MKRARSTALVATLAALLAGAAPAGAAKRCAEPREEWERATAAEAGMDAGRLQEALDYGTQNAGFAVRVYRRGCLVGEDRFAGLNRDQRFESWSMAKSVTSMMFGRAMTLGLVQPDDPVGALVAEADAAHGAITMRDLLTMTSGLRWNGLRDYNVFTMPDRVRDALTLEAVRRPGTYFEYAQSAVSLLAEAVGRAVGEDPGRWFKRELTGRLGIPHDKWFWVRDSQGHIGGFYGVNMRPDDFGRLGELMRRGGVWQGRRLLSRRYLREAVTPTATNGCYGWLIWVNAGAPCVGPRIAERPVVDARDFPSLPADMYRFSGLFGQLVTVFPSQELVVVRTGQDPNLAPTGGTSWELGLYERVLAAVTDQKIAPPGDAPVQTVDRANSDTGFQNALLEPDQYAKGVAQDPLGPPGPRRARALWVRLAAPRPSRRGVVTLRAGCPAGGTGTCAGTATLEGARRPARYALRAGSTKPIRLRLTRAALRSTGGWRTFTAVSDDAAGGTVTRLAVQLKPRRR